MALSLPTANQYKHLESYGTSCKISFYSIFVLGDTPLRPPVTAKAGVDDLDLHELSVIQEVDTPTHITTFDETLYPSMNMNSNARGKEYSRYAKCFDDYFNFDSLHANLDPFENFRTRLSKRTINQYIAELFLADLWLSRAQFLSHLWMFHQSQSQTLQMSQSQINTITISQSGVLSLIVIPTYLAHQQALMIVIHSELHQR